MSDLPRLVSVSLASRISGVSRETFVRRYLKLVDVERSPGGRARVVLASIEPMVETLFGRTVTPAAYLEADRKLDAARRRQSAYRNRLRGQSQGEAYDPGQSS